MYGPHQSFGTCRILALRKNTAMAVCPEPESWFASAFTELLPLHDHNGSTAQADTLSRFFVPSGASWPSTVGDPANGTSFAEYKQGRVLVWQRIGQMGDKLLQSARSLNRWDQAGHQVCRGPGHHTHPVVSRNSSRTAVDRPSDREQCCRFFTAPEG